MTAPKVISVAQLNYYIHQKFEADGNLKLLSVRGEASNVKYHSAGHIYFTLKDSRSSISCVMFRQSRSGLAFRLEEGQEIVVTGSVSVFERDGRYQIYASSIELFGQGQLYERYEKLKARLEEMGMFDPIYKKPIPAFVRTLGVVTAPTGAAVRDIINVSRRRYPYIRILLYPAKVQGEGAAESVAKGIRALDAAGVDCIIAGRGGGSIEDLWAFNEEVVARAIFECNTPLISAVGHETDTTIADWAADLRAPTPSAAAELAVFDYQGVLEQLAACRSRLDRLMVSRISGARTKCESLGAKLSAASPESRIREQRMMLIRLQEALESSMKEQLTARKHRLQLYAGRLEGVSPLLKLSQGFSVAEDASGHTVSSIAGVNPGDHVTVHVRDGDIAAEVLEVTPVGRGEKHE